MPAPAAPADGVEAPKGLIGAFSRAVAAVKASAESVKKAAKGAPSSEHGDSAPDERPADCGCGDGDEKPSKP